uniref:hypothetical protein n=1 Tax=Clostridium sp. NkU-1 TaxID=1095009 RepID=UPI0006D17827
MRKGLVRGLAYVMCAAMAITAVPPWAVYAENGQTIENAIHTATPSEADRDTGDNEEVEENETGGELEFGLETEEREEENFREATPSEAIEAPKELPTILPAKMAVKAAASSSLGDIWDTWAGKTSFEFLSGTQGEGTKEKTLPDQEQGTTHGIFRIGRHGNDCSGCRGSEICRCLFRMLFRPWRKH